MYINDVSLNKLKSNLGLDNIKKAPLVPISNINDLVWKNPEAKQSVNKAYKNSFEAISVVWLIFMTSVVIIMNTAIVGIVTFLDDFWLGVMYLILTAALACISLNHIIRYIQLRNHIKDWKIEKIKNRNANRFLLIASVILVVAIYTFLIAMGTFFSYKSILLCSCAVSSILIILGIILYVARSKGISACAKVLNHYHNVIAD